MQALRRRRRPVPAAVLAEELGVSLRTIYRDIATLVAQGAPIAGEAGLGYELRQGMFLPPLMFSADEVDALLFGLRLVQQRGDAELDRAATDALAKIEAVLPEERKSDPRDSALLAGPSRGAPHLAAIRRAIRDWARLRLSYTDQNGTPSERVVWPLAVGFFDAGEMLAAWCETRRDFRHFRLDRIGSALCTDERIPVHRRVLLAEWRVREGIATADRN